jgi:uncharacterized protein YbjT (DUF2867 family)
VDRYVILAGGSGFIGRALAESLAERGYEPVILTRRAGQGESRWREVAWDGRTVGGWAETLEGAVAVVNLTGRSPSIAATRRRTGAKP